MRVAVEYRVSPGSDILFPIIFDNLNAERGKGVYVDKITYLRGLM